MQRMLFGLLVALVAGCGAEEAKSGSSSGDLEEKYYALHVKVAFKDDGQGVAIGAQNGAIVRVPAADIAGKKLVWATAPGGESIFNVLPIENGSTSMQPDLTGEFTTSPRYGDGPWEMALFVSIAGESALKGPQPGDLAAFDNSAPPEGEPPVTGVSVRMTVKGAEPEISIDNPYFIQY